MTAVRVFESVMCCSTAICGPSVDPELIRFAADLDWLRTQINSRGGFPSRDELAAWVGFGEATEAATPEAKSVGCYGAANAVEAATAMSWCSCSGAGMRPAKVVLRAQVAR